MKGKLVQIQEESRVTFQYNADEYYFRIHPKVNNKFADIKRDNNNQSVTFNIQSESFDEDLQIDVLIPQKLTFLSKRDFVEEQEDAYEVMTEDFQFYDRNGDLLDDPVSIGTKVHKKKRATVPPRTPPNTPLTTGVPPPVLFPWKKVATGLAMLVGLAILWFGVRTIMNMDNTDDEHVLKFLSEYHADTDTGNKEALMSKMQFPIAKYYELGEMSELGYSKIIDTYYTKSIDSCRTYIDIADIKTIFTTIEKGDGIPEYMFEYEKVIKAEYPITYLFYKNGKKSEYDIKVRVILLEDANGNLKISAIEELTREKVITKNSSNESTSQNTNNFDDAKFGDSNNPNKNDKKETGDDLPLPIANDNQSDSDSSPVKKQEDLIDYDGDGFMSSIDCDDRNSDILGKGSICDDGDSKTVNDIIDFDCECRGSKKSIVNTDTDVVDNSRRPSPDKAIWYTDHDKDGKGDPNLPLVAEANFVPSTGTWARNADDECPTRKGDSNGCPTLNLELPIDFNVSQQIRASLILGDLKNSDIVNWSIPNGIIKNAGSLSTIQLTGDIVGYYDIEAVINGTIDDYTDKITKRVHVKMNPDDLKQNYLLPILRKAYAKSGNFATTKSKIEARFNQHTNNKDIMVYDDADLELNPLSIFLTVDLTKKVIDINVLDITYDRKTGKISSIKIKLVKD